MQTRQILALHSNEPTAEWGDGPLGRVSAQLLAAFQAKEAARLDAAETNSALAGKGPVLAALQRRFAEESAVQLFDVAMPMTSRLDFHELLKQASRNAPKDRGLKVAAKHAEQLWLRDQKGVLAVGDVARFRAHYATEYPRTTITAVLDAELPKIGFNTLPVQKLAQLALSIQGATQEDLEHSYTTVVRMNGLDSDKPEHIRARAYLRGLVNLAEEDTSRTASADRGGDSAVERTLRRMATGDDQILRSVTASSTEMGERAMDEMEQYLEKTGELHSQKKAIIESIQRKMKRGRYDAEMAPAQWLRWVDAGAQAYTKEFGNPGEDIFPRHVRAALAQKLAEQYEQAILSGEYGPVEAQLEEEPLMDDLPADISDVEAEVPHDESSEAIAEVDSPITGEPLALELGMSMETEDVEGLAHFGQLDDFDDSGGFMGDGVDDDVSMIDEGSGETTTTIEDPSAPGEFVDVTLTPAGGDEDSALVPAPMGVPMESSAARKSTFSVYAIRGGQRGKEPIDSVQATSMPLALAAIGTRLAEVGSSDYQVRAPADEFRRHALIVLDAAAGNHLYVVANDLAKQSKESPKKAPSKSAPKGVDMEPAISGQPDDVVSVGADGGKTLTAASIESQLLADEAVTAGAWKILVNASGDVELQKSGKRIIAKSLVEMDEVISTFILRAGVTAPTVAKAASYDLNALMLVGCQQCGGLDEYLMPKVASPVKCARCGGETPARVISAQMAARSVTPGYVLVTDIPGEDKAMNARRLLMAMREVHPSAQGDVREDGRMEISLRSIDERALSRIRNVLASKFGVHHQLTRTARTAETAGSPEKPPMMGVNIAPAAQPANSPTYTPPTPAINPPLGLATPAAPPQPQPTPTPQTQVGPAQMPGMQVQVPTPGATNTTMPSAMPTRAGFRIVYRSDDGRSRAMPVEARDEGMARRIFASYRGDAQILSVTAQELPPEMPPEMEPSVDEAPAAPSFAGPSQQMQTISPEIKEAISAAMMTFRNSGIDVASGVKVFQTQFKKLIERFGDETAPARQMLGAEIIRAAQNAWSRPALLEMAAARTAGDTPAHKVDQTPYWGGHDDDDFEEHIEMVPGMSERDQEDVDMPDDAERVELGYPVKGQRMAAPGKPGKPGKMPLPSGIKVQQAPRVSVPKNVLGPDSEGDEPSVLAPKVKTQHGAPGGKLSPTNMGGGEEDADPKVMNPKKPPANGQYGLVGKGTSLSDPKLGPDSQTGNNSTTKSWDSVSKGAPKNIRSK